jgi:hypothetical protein
MNIGLCVCFLVFFTVDLTHSQLKFPSGFGENNKDPRYFIKIKRVLCESNPALVTTTHCIMKLERNTNGKHSIGLKFAATERKMTVRNSVAIIQYR